jgi:hypothetical protein
VRSLPTGRSKCLEKHWLKRMPQRQDNPSAVCIA